MQLLSGRKYKWPTGKQVNVQMKHGLTSIGVGVDHNAITVLCKSLFTRDLRRGQQKVSKLILVFEPSRIERVHMIARDDENMRRGLWGEIVERDAQLVLKHPGRRDFTRSN